MAALHKPEIAKHFFHTGFGIISARETDPKIKVTIDRALANPTPEHLCQAEQVTRGTAWYEGVLFALAIVGMSAAEIVLGDRS